MGLTSLVERLREELIQRESPDGGFYDRPGGQYRVDATAWSILALRACGLQEGVLERHYTRLFREQGPDGRVWLSAHHPKAYWPTAITILAWGNSSLSQMARNRAIQFLLGTSGEHYTKKPDDPAAHDPSLKGWPWIEGTHSWVEPTANCVLALRLAGQRSHSRVKEAIRMLLDRQLPHGGWNAGNTVVFGRELHPMPEGTGSALVSLVGEVEERQVARSLAYLQGEVERLRTPLSLGWGILGLGAWGLRPPNGAALVDRCVTSQSRYGLYDTSAIALLLLAALAGDPENLIPIYPASKITLAVPSLDP